MSIRWSGPYCSATTADGAKVTWEPLRGCDAPCSAVKFVVRWRVSVLNNPRKRTFSDEALARGFALQVETARVLQQPCDDKGYPVRSAPSRVTDDASAAVAESPASRTTPTPTPVLSHDTDTTQPAAKGKLGSTVAQYIERVIHLESPEWKQQGFEGKSDIWWKGQLGFIKAVMLYGENDDRLAKYGLEAGASIHLSLLRHEDFNDALMLRRTVNLRAEHNNRQKQEKYDRLEAVYAQKLALWNTGTGPRGRKPVPPRPPVLEASVSPDGSPIISATTEKAFRTAMSFVFDRAFDAGHFPPGPNPFRTWNPRGNGGRRRVKRSPFRRVRPVTAQERAYHGLGFWVDLGDALAERGARLEGGIRAGERYRILPLTIVQLATRPGESLRLRADHCDGADARIVPPAGGHLKMRPDGESRTAPLSEVVRTLIKNHVEAGLAGADGTLFVSPQGYELDSSNFCEDYLRPAVDKLDDLWPALPSLRNATLYDFRKAGITTWVTYGADTLVASRWSGHDEHELMKSYRGIIEGIGSQAKWEGMDDMVEKALLDSPPRGNGLLARRIRDWLGLPPVT
ncbi:hypothetical protein [Arthrobacter sp. NEB 688]|uniref:hypothetical protein n=1 Tax=Arthrobacter sp. NEB 688 TaxID=904039 RepID=UPI0015661AA6|nr:hypothetical protein [Arthrobacter sp. NEB 688]QKE82894.1 hypothetical protein HL663_02290 [Arthrobacter sp. NEB 688]